MPRGSSSLQASNFTFARRTSLNGTKASEAAVAGEKQSGGGRKQTFTQKQKQEPFKAWVHANVNGEAQRPVEMVFQ
ncbi:hypothetical protein NUW54_g7362 [Trametes sanguinea]|uniref:Uncharacterized protein n=1 Tax=Trametes sanguinea TaxID=158606 RepID=A0ACC1PP20_9APHY|nr:hypothetical protein NUW54_g7362 [Trametes sanguinea]